MATSEVTTRRRVAVLDGAGRHELALAPHVTLADAVRSLGIDRRNTDAVFSLLAVNFTQKGEGPEGTLELVLSGDASIALDVECVEVQLADTGGAWETSLKPRHPAV